MIVLIVFFVFVCKFIILDFGEMELVKIVVFVVVVFVLGVVYWLVCD